MIGFDAYRRPGTIDYQLAAVCVRHFLGVIDRICTGTATLYYPSSVSYDPDSNTEFYFSVAQIISPQPFNLLSSSGIHYDISSHLDLLISHRPV